MKNLKNILLMSVLTVGSLCFLGVNKVDALDYSFSLVCEPEAIEPGETSNCYLVGSAKEVSGDLHGFVTQAYTTDALKLKGASVTGNVPNTKAAFMKAASASTGGTAISGTNLPGTLGSFKCVYDSNAPGAKEGMDYGCAVFYSTTTANAFTNAALIKGNTAEMLPNGSQSLKSDGTSLFAVVGSYQVELPENVDYKALQSCGEICVKAWKIPTSEYYDKYTKCQSATPEGGECEAASSLQTQGKDGANYFCNEISKVGALGSETGAFASYAVLVAGALIAISAIAIAKKHNKLYRI